VKKLIIAIASGKGGTGKTTVVTNLALALQNSLPVQVLDCDVEEPNAHLFLHPDITYEDEVTLPVPEVEQAKCNGCGKCSEICAFNAIAVAGEKVITFPEMCHGCGGCTIVCPTGAISEKPHRIGVVSGGKAGRIFFAHGRVDVGTPLAPPLVKAVKKYASGSAAVLIDAPPGTSCPVVAAVKDTDFCLLVTEPTPFGLNDLKLAVGMVRELNVPMGVVINRYNEDYTEVSEYCRQEQIPVLLQIPFARQYAATYARGRCLVQDYPEWLTAFGELWYKIERLVQQHARATGN
jgi:MinD superfamily P-loop ATPase